MAEAMASSNFTTILTEPLHNYYPLDATIAHYAANINSVPYLLGIFFSACAALFTATYFVTTALNPSLTRAQHATIMWFVLSGTIHIFFEGFYVLHFADIGGSQALIGQMWKEYAYSDSRYLTSNAFVLCMESVTAMLWGPGCFLCAWLVARQHEARYAATVIVSMGQLYGGCSPLVVLTRDVNEEVAGSIADSATREQAMCCTTRRPSLTTT